MPVSRAAWLIAALAVFAFGVLSVIYFLFANPNTNRGLHLVVALDAKELRETDLRQLVDDARQRLREARIAFEDLGIADGAVQLRVAKTDETEAAVKALRSIGTGVEVGSAEGGRVTVTLAGQGERMAKAVQSTVDILRRRFDAAGIAIRRMDPDGRDRIRIHAANPDDAARLKDSIAKAGRLSLHEVHPSMTAAEAEGGRRPPGYRVYPSAPAQAGSQLLRTIPAVRGDELVGAQAGFDARTNDPVITFRLNANGARKLAHFTQSNVNRPLAIVIDDVVVSAPIIREPILGGTGQVSGGFTVPEAQALAIRLSSGALPTKLAIVEERVVTSDR